MNDSTVERVVLWMVSGLAGDDLENACIAKLNVEPTKVKRLIRTARKRLTLAAEYNRDELLGTAMTRLNDLYGRCIRQQDESKALAVQREINRLTGLYGQAGSGDGGETDEAAEEVEAVAEQLHGLDLASLAYPLREHARLAVQRIRELEAQTGRQKEGDKP